MARALLQLDVGYPWKSTCSGARMKYLDEYITGNHHELLYHHNIKARQTYMMMQTSLGMALPILQIDTMFPIRHYSVRNNWTLIIIW